MDKKTLAAVTVIFIAGIIYRYFLATAGPNYIQHDSAVYQAIAENMYQGKWMGDAGNRTYYYPVYLVFVFRIFGFDSIAGVRFAQSLTDSVTGLFIFGIIMILTRKKVPALAAYVLYMVNPLTSTYSGLYLTEVLSSLSTAMMLAACLIKKNTWFWWGAAVAFWGTVRLAFFPVALFLLPAGIILHYREKLKVKAAHFGLAVAAFLILMIYPLLSNFMMNGKVTLFPNDDISKFYLYEGLKAHYMQEVWNGQDNAALQPGVVWAWQFYNLPADLYAQKANDILGLYIKGVFANPLDFAKWRVIHAAMEWNKTHLYYYLDPSQPFSGDLLPFGNIVILGLSAVGLIRYFRKFWRSNRLFLISVMVSLFISTALLCLKPPEERLTVPLYPIVFLFAGLGIGYFWDKRPEKIRPEKLGETV